MTKDEGRKEKILKLLAKAERAGTEEEAEAFSAKAQELMTQWAIDSAMLHGARERKEDPIVVKVIGCGGIYMKADAGLWNRVAKVNDCRVALDTYRKEVTLVGHASDVENVELLVTSLLIQVARSTRSAPAGLSGFDRFVWRRSFREGFAVEVGNRLAAARKNMVDEADDRTGDLLPVLAERKAQVDEYVAGLGWGRGRASRSKHSAAGAGAGREAGRRADVGNPRVTAGGRKALAR